MATEEIEISELEFTEELASDNLIPVESTTDTKATSLQILKNWLSGFFVGKTGNETISGIKTFEQVIKSYQNARMIERINKDTKKTVATVETVNDTTNNGLGLYAFSEDGTQNVSTWLRYNNGSPYAIFSNNYTLVDFDKTKKIATTEFVSKHGISVKGNNYIKLGDGTIIQWGGGSNYNGTVTLPTPFSSTGYQALIIDTSVTSVAVNEKTTTNFKYNTGYGTNRAIGWLAIGR